jgi:hypothetical protein
MTKTPGSNALTPQQAKQFAEHWLPAWTGNNPELLASFYTEDAFYSDPGIREGLQGKTAILEYFKKLLKHNPNWIWKQTGSVPLGNGFLNKWLAEIPVGNKVIVCTGVCTVQLKDNLIYRNEVHFDRTELLQEIAKFSSAK